MSSAEICMDISSGDPWGQPVNNRARQSSTSSTGGPNTSPKKVTIKTNGSLRKPRSPLSSLSSYTPIASLHSPTSLTHTEANQSQFSLALSAPLASGESSNMTSLAHLTTDSLASSSMASSLNNAKTGVVRLINCSPAVNHHSASSEEGEGDSVSLSPDSLSNRRVEWDSDKEEDKPSPADDDEEGKPMTFASGKRRVSYDRAVEGAAEIKRKISSVKKKLRFYYEARFEISQKLSSLKQELSQIETLELEAIDEMKVERSLLDVQYEKELSQVQMDKQKMVFLGKQHSERIAEMIQEREEFRQLMDMERQKLEELEEQLSRLQERHRSADSSERVSFQRQIQLLEDKVDHQRRIYEDLEFQQLEDQARFDEEKETMMRDLVCHQNRLLTQYQATEGRLESLQQEQGHVLQSSSSQMARLAERREGVGDAMRREQRRLGIAESHLEQLSGQLTALQTYQETGLHTISLNPSNFSHSNSHHHSIANSEYQTSSSPSNIPITPSLPPITTADNKTKTQNGLPPSNRTEPVNEDRSNPTKPISSLPKNRPEQVNGIPSNRTEAVNGDPSNEIEQINGLPSNRSEQVNGLPSNRTVAVNGLPSNRTEAVNGFPSNRTETVNGLPSNRTIGLSGVPSNLLKGLKGGVEGSLGSIQASGSSPSPGDSSGDPLGSSPSHVGSREASTSGSIENCKLSLDYRSGCSLDRLAGDDGYVSASALPLRIRNKASLSETGRNKEARPLTRYLPATDADFDLRRHIESSGHQLDPLLSRVHVDTSSCAGYMWKMGGRIKTWRKRWFVFDRTKRFFAYFPNKKSTKMKGCISFTDIRDVFVDHLHRVKSPNPRLTFCVETPDRTFFLVAHSAELMRVWIDVLFSGAEGYLALNPHQNSIINSLRNQ